MFYIIIIIRFFTTTRCYHYTLQVFMACRDMEKCEAARREIVLETQNKYVYCRPCDLASTASIVQFVKT